MFNFAAKRHWFLIAAAVVIILCIVSAAIPGGLKTGIDFKPATKVELGPKEGETLDIELVKGLLSDLGYDQAARKIQVSEDHFIFYLPEMDEAGRKDVESKLNEIGQVVEIDFSSASVASNTVRNAAIATAVATVAMLLYITWAFRKVPHSVRYGTAAIVALIFNLVVTVGVYAVLGRTLGWEVDPMFIVALLAIIGYSVNDSIVVLDRIRENKARGIMGGGDYDSMVNFSISETLVRSLNTGMTTLLAILAVYLIVGGPIRGFLVALFVGIVAGTYSSIFVAGQLLVMWEHGDWIKLIPGASRLQKNKA
jgi:preprotein translocase subunit SecF